MLGNSSFADLVTGPCLATGGWWTNNFAAHDDSAVVLMQETRPLEDGRTETRVVVNGLTAAHNTQFVLDVGYVGTSEWRTADVVRTLATDDGYAVLWARRGFAAGQQTNRSFLTFIGEDGGFRGTIEVGAYANDIVWNGQGFGLIRDGYVDGVRSATFERLTDRGQVVESLVIPTGDVGETLRIAASGDDYAIAYGINDQHGAFNLSFTPITCQ